MPEPTYEFCDVLPGDGEVFERIYAQLRAEGHTSTPLVNTPEWFAWRARQLRQRRRRI
jgi:hypothetical protein